MFWFAAGKFNFWPVYDAIKKYYPVGVAVDEDSRSPFYTTYPGYKAWVQLLNDNFHLTDNSQSRWKDFEAEIRIKTEKNFVGTTYGQVPCFSAYIEIEKSTFGDVVRTKELHFFVSLLGPFYTIIGQEKSEVKIEYNTERYGTRERHYPAVHYLTVSPEKEYADSFNLLCNIIEERFSGHQFVPFFICNQTIEGLQVPNINKKAVSVFDALFFPAHIYVHATVTGDESFKADDWIKEGYVDDGSRWYAFPPGWTEEQMKAAIENTKPEA